MATIKDRQLKGARNQSLFRDLNERVADVGDRIPDEEMWHFVCECARTDCVELVVLTRTEYGAIRRMPTWFPIKPGHDDPLIEHVVEVNERYAVADKIGDAGRLAAELDPRS